MPRLALPRKIDPKAKIQAELTPARHRLAALRTCIGLNEGLGRAIATTDPLQGSIALAMGRGANQWREGWWSFPPEWYGVFVGDLKWVKTGVIFWGAGL